MCRASHDRPPELLVLPRPGVLAVMADTRGCRHGGVADPSRMADRDELTHLVGSVVVGVRFSADAGLAGEST